MHAHLHLNFIHSQFTPHSNTTVFIPTPSSYLQEVHSSNHIRPTYQTVSSHHYLSNQAQLSLASNPTSLPPHQRAGTTNSTSTLLDCLSLSFFPSGPQYLPRQLSFDFAELHKKSQFLPEELSILGHKLGIEQEAAVNRLLNIIRLQQLQDQHLSSTQSHETGGPLPEQP